MKPWHLQDGDPLALTLAADARLSGTDYCDDQIWELRLGGGETPAVALRTTFGLRARAFRIFPLFCAGDEDLSDPQAFFRSPVLECIYPSYARLRFAPFEDIDVQYELWVPDSKAAAGRVSLTNRDSQARSLEFELAAVLMPGEGSRMAPEEMHAATVLSGESDGLFPIVFMTGGPQAGGGPFPSLLAPMTLEPGQTRALTWTHAALSNAEESFELARRTAARSWEAETARVELENASLLEIETGNPDWDAALALSQKQALLSFVGPNQSLPELSFVHARQPEHGFSLRGDGSDYSHMWSGQTPLESYFLASVLLPGASDVIRGLVRNFLSTQDGDREVDWKPGLAGQRSWLLATPLLATLSWRVYRSSREAGFLEEVFPGLLRYVRSWFSQPHDRDGDGCPEWDHPMQSGFDEHPLFSRWTEGSLGVDIATAESPSLCAFLYSECYSLILMADLLGRREVIPEMQRAAARLQESLAELWDPERSVYRYRDRESHHTGQMKELYDGAGAGTVFLDRAFEPPARLHIRVTLSEGTSIMPEVFIHGYGPQGQHRVEHVINQQFKWNQAQGNYTGQRVYKEIEKVEIKGLKESDRMRIYRVGFDVQDLTTTLPLWAGMVDAQRAKALIENNLLEAGQYWRPFGLPTCPHMTQEDQAAGNQPPACFQVSVIWNSLICQGLLTYGYREQAVELLSCLLEAIIQNLKNERSFYRRYHSETGQGLGEHNALGGLAPVSLLLDILGVRLISNDEVFLHGFNPFPHPITVRYRGLKVVCEADRTLVTFPDGQQAIIDDPSPRTVSLENPKTERIR